MRVSITKAYKRGVCRPYLVAIDQNDQQWQLFHGWAYTDPRIDRLVERVNAVGSIDPELWKRVVGRI